MTENSLSAHRTNGRKTRGPATAAGKRRSAAASLRHGFYSQTRDEALMALGEDPAEYRRLLHSPADDLKPKAGLESEVVSLMARTVWRMWRAERMQDGLALKRIRSGTDREDMSTGIRFSDMYDIHQRLLVMARALNRPDYTPSEAQIRAWVDSFGANVPAGVAEVVPLLRALRKAAPQQTEPANPGQVTEPAGQAADGQEADQLREEIRNVMLRVTLPYAESTSTLMQRCNDVHSPENLAALMAPKEENAMLMQRMEDSSLRQLWRLTNTLMRLREGALN
jgi:hypothetical protein